MKDIRELTSHRVNGLNEALRVLVLDGKGSGGAHHEYVVLVPLRYTEEEAKEVFPTSDWERAEPHCWTDTDFNPWAARFLGDKAFITKNGEDGLFYRVQRISFQNGPVKEAGYNGNSHEALLAILIDRLECFQKGPYAGSDNALALVKLDEARLWLHKRTMDRSARGVEGTHQK